MKDSGALHLYLFGLLIPTSSLFSNSNSISNSISISISISTSISFLTQLMAHNSAMCNSIQTFQQHYSTPEGQTGHNLLRCCQSLHITFNTHLPLKEDDQLHCCLDGWVSHLKSYSAVYLTNTPTPAPIATHTTTTPKKIAICRLQQPSTRFGRRRI